MGACGTGRSYQPFPVTIKSMYWTVCPWPKLAHVSTPTIESAEANATVDPERSCVFISTRPETDTAGMNHRPDIHDRCMGNGHI